MGDGVFAIGSPLGLERTVTQGILSTKTRELEGELYFQTSTQINPGNSGGPLFNLAGEVVGVTNMKITFGEGLGFAIPGGTGEKFSRPPRRLCLLDGQSEQSVPLPRTAEPHRR